MLAAYVHANASNSDARRIPLALEPDRFPHLASEVEAQLPTTPNAGRLTFSFRALLSTANSVVVPTVGTVPATIIEPAGLAFSCLTLAPLNAVVARAQVQQVDIDNVFFHGHSLSLSY
jgi:hypothetical protein